MDTRGNIGIALRRGRRSDEISAYIKMAESLISYYQEDPNNIPSHYYIGSISMGQGVSKDKEPTTQNLDQLRDNAYGCFTREFLKSIVLPLAEMYENQMLHEPDIRFVSQNNGTGETPDKLY